MWLLTPPKIVPTPLRLRKILERSLLEASTLGNNKQDVKQPHASASTSKAPQWDTTVFRILQTVTP